MRECRPKCIRTGLYRYIFSLSALLGVVPTAQSAPPDGCLHLLGIREQTPSQISSQAHAFLTLIRIGLDNIVSELGLLTRNITAMAASAHPVNPFVNLDQPLARALAGKVEPLLAQLDSEWPSLQVRVAEQSGESMRQEEARQKDSVQTRKTRALIRVPIEPDYFGKKSVWLPRFRFNGQTESHYLLEYSNTTDGVRKRFQIAKDDLSISEMDPDLEGWGVSGVNYRELGQIGQKIAHLSIINEYFKQDLVPYVRVHITNDISARSVTYSYPVELYGEGAEYHSFLPVGSASSPDEALLHMHHFAGSGLLRLTAIDRESWVEKPVHVQGGPHVGSEGSWSTFRNLQGEILLEFFSFRGAIRAKSVSSGTPHWEVALWKYDSDDGTFKLVFHEEDPSGRNESLVSALIDYEAKSFVGVVLSTSLIVVVDRDISKGRLSP